MKKIKHKEISPEALTMVAARFKVLAEPVRLQLLQLLESGSYSVTALAAKIDTTQPNVSKHLKILQDDGLVSRRIDGNAVYYEIADDSVFELCGLVCGSLRVKFEERSAMFG